MTRTAGITTIYTLFAALAVAAPLSASEEPVSPAEAPVAPVEEPVAPVEEPVAPVEEPVAPVEEPVAPVEEPAPVEPEPEPEPEPEAQTIRDDAPVEEPTAVAVAAANATVTIRDFEFAPGSVTIDQGDTVTWRNDGPTAHSATAEDGSFDTGIYEAGQSRSHTFENAGTFNYICTPHPQMRGTITVQAASSGGGQQGGEDGDAGSTAGQTDTTDDGPTLPATGIDSGGLIALGLATLALGAFLRRRSAPSN